MVKYNNGAWNFILNYDETVAPNSGIAYINTQTHTNFLRMVTHHAYIIQGNGDYFRIRFLHYDLRYTKLGFVWKISIKSRLSCSNTDARSEYVFQTLNEDFPKLYQKIHFSIPNWNRPLENLTISCVVNDIRAWNQFRWEKEFKTYFLENLIKSGLNGLITEETPSLKPM